MRTTTETSLKHRIHSYLEQMYGFNPNKWVNGGTIEELAMQKGYKASNASRRLRELVDEAVIERQEMKASPYSKRATVHYRYIPYEDRDLQKLALMFNGKII